MKTLADVRKRLNDNVTVQLFSATAKTGVDEARDVLKTMMKSRIG
jgi:GTP-binding protein EngB required for normal cell division